MECNPHKQHAENDHCSCSQLHTSTMFKFWLKMLLNIQLRLAPQAHRCSTVAILLLRRRRVAAIGRRGPAILRLLHGPAEGQAVAQKPSGTGITAAPVDYATCQACTSQSLTSSSPATNLRRRCLLEGGQRLILGAVVGRRRRRRRMLWRRTLQTSQCTR